MESKASVFCASVVPKSKILPNSAQEELVCIFRFLYLVDVKYPSVLIDSLSVHVNGWRVVQHLRNRPAQYFS